MNVPAVRSQFGPSTCCFSIPVDLQAFVAYIRDRIPAHVDNGSIAEAQGFEQIQEIPESCVGKCTRGCVEGSG